MKHRSEMFDAGISEKARYENRSHAKAKQNFQVKSNSVFKQQFKKFAVDVESVDRFIFCARPAVLDYAKVALEIPKRISPFIFTVEAQ